MLKFNKKTLDRDIQKLEQKDRLRRDLVANLAHDLQRPISSIRGYLETLLLKNSDLTPSERENYLKIVLSNTIQLSNLIDDLLDLSKLEAKQIQPCIQEFSIVDLINDVILKLNQAVVKKDIILLTHIPSQLPLVSGDIGLMERAITNLLDNAIRYTPFQGRIKIELAERNQTVRVIIGDTGYGISPGDLPRIFDRYYRRKKTNNSKENSTGLGLAIAQKIVELHGSTINVKSRLGAGTIIHFNLPIFDNDGEMGVKTIEANL